MNTEEYQHRTYPIKMQYQTRGIHLNDAQAIKILQYEEDKDFFSLKYFFSQWEEWDYEQDTLLQILNHEQYTAYEKKLKEAIQQYQQDLTERDKNIAKDVAYVEELLQFHKTNIFPFLSAYPTALHLGFIDQSSKIEYLKKEYATFLKESKKEILVNHFRMYKNFQPNRLKHLILGNKIDHLFPNYQDFKYKMEEPTTTINNFIVSKLPKRLYETSYNKPKDSLYKKMETWKEQIRIIREKHHTEKVGIWYKEDQQNEDKSFQDLHMSLLLFDKDMYGLDN